MDGFSMFHPCPSCCLPFCASICPPCLDTSSRFSCIGMGVRHCPVQGQFDECLQLDVTPQSPSITPWPVMSAPCCSSRHYCHCYWQAGHFQNISVVHPHLGSIFKESESSPFGHTFWILSGLAGADITQLLISSPEALNSNGRLPFAFIFFSHSTNRAPFKFLLLCIHFTQISSLQ